MDKKDIEVIFSDSSSQQLYTHSVFCQCALPVRRLPKEITKYQTTHGNTSLMVSAGELFKGRNFENSIQCEVPSGAKARLLFSYINDQAIRTGNPDIDMGENLHQFLLKNKIKDSGQNRKEIQAQARNIGTASIYLGIWEEKNDSQYVHQENMRIAKSMSFWLESENNQLNLWQPTMTLSPEYMAALESHRVPIDFNVLVELQMNPRAMDLYVWLKYRINSIKSPIKISYNSLFPTFGQGIAEIKSFKKRFKDALLLAAPHVPNLVLDIDSKNITLTNESRSFIAMDKSIKKTEGDKLSDRGSRLIEQAALSDQADSIAPTQEATPSYYTLLSGFGLSGVQIADYEKRYSQDQIDTAISVTQNAIERKGGLANPAGYFNSAVINGWQLPKSKKQEEESSSTSGDISVGKGSSSSDSLSPEEHIAIEGSLDARWGEILVALHTQFGEATYNSWFRKMQLDTERTTSDTLVIYTPTKFIKEWLLKHYGDALLKEATSTGASWGHIKMYVGKRKKSNEQKAVKALELADA